MEELHITRVDMTYSYEQGTYELVIKAIATHDNIQKFHNGKLFIVPNSDMTCPTCGAPL